MHWRHKSPARGGILAFGSLLAAMKLSHFPNNSPNWLIVFPALIIAACIADTSRCMLGRWTWYHGGVLLVIYMELMAFTLAAFLLLYPLWL